MMTNDIARTMYDAAQINGGQEHEAAARCPHEGIAPSEATCLTADASGRMANATQQGQLGADAGSTPAPLTINEGGQDAAGKQCGSPDEGSPALPCTASGTESDCGRRQHATGPAAPVPPSPPIATRVLMGRTLFSDEVTAPAPDADGQIQCENVANGFPACPVIAAQAALIARLTRERDGARDEVARWQNICVDDAKTRDEYLAECERLRAVVKAADAMRGQAGAHVHSETDHRICGLCATMREFDAARWGCGARLAPT